MRTSPDFYQDFSGKIWAVWQDTKPPRDSILIYGYDYHRQKWITEGDEKIKKLEKNGVKIQIWKGQEK